MARTTDEMRDSLPLLLDNRGLSLRELARRAGVSQAYLSRVLGAQSPRPASAKVARDVALALDLPEDYFPEYRRAVVERAIVTDGELRDRIFDEIHESGRSRHGRARD